MYQPTNQTIGFPLTKDLRSNERTQIESTLDFAQDALGVAVTHLTKLKTYSL